MRKDVVSLVQRTVREALASRERVVLAVSGGLDSMVLLHAAASAARDAISVATFDHGTGSAGADAARLVSRCCDGLGVECAVGRAGQPLRSEAELRDARWRFLRNAARARRAVVATAHTEDDQIETVLMRVLRDAGARGLAGLYADSPVVRPLLRIRRGQLEAYAKATDVEWVEDPSNQSRRYLRNRLRHDLLPALRRVRPTIDAELLATACDAAAWRAGVEAFVAAELGAAELDVRASVLAHRPTPELNVLWPAIAARAGIALDRRGIVRLAAFTARGRVGSMIELAGGWRVVRSRDAFQLRASAQRETAGSIPLEGAVRWGDWSFRPSDGPGRSDSMSAHLPVSDALWIRSWRAGDTMVAHPGRPPRKVKRLLSRAGITGHDRVGWPVVLLGDQIVWIPGVRRADAATERSGRPGLTFVCEYHRR